MFEIYADKTSLVRLELEQLVSGTKDIYKVKVGLSYEYAGLKPIIVFKAGDNAVDIFLESDEVIIPWEVLSVPDRTLYVGIHAIDENGNIILSTAWASLGEVLSGTELSNTESKTPTPEIASQLLSAFKSAEEATEDLLERASNGEFNGEPGPPGPPGPKGDDGNPGENGKTPQFMVNNAGHLICIFD